MLYGFVGNSLHGMSLHWTSTEDIDRLSDPTCHARDMYSFGRDVDHGLLSDMGMLDLSSSIARITRRTGKLTSGIGEAAKYPEE